MPTYNLTIDDASPAWLWKGAWQDATNRDGATPKYSFGTFHATNVPGSSVTLPFNGTAITVFGAKRDNHQLYQANVDGNGGIFDGYAAAPYQFQVPLFFANNLSPTSQHTAFLSDASTDSANPWFDVDHAIVTFGDGNSSTNSIDTVLDDGDANVTYSGNDWALGIPSTSTLASSYYNSTFRVTNTPGATASIAFYGNAIQIYGAVSNNHGAFSVALDGMPAVSLTGQSFTFHAQVLLYQWSALPTGMHKVVLTSTSTNSSEYLDLDKIVVSRWEGFPTSTDGSSSNSGSNSSPTPSPSHTHTNVALIAGVVVGVIALVVIVGLLVFFFLRRRRRNSQRVYNDKSPRDAAALGLGRGTGHTPPQSARDAADPPPPLSPPVAPMDFVPQGNYVPPSTSAYSSSAGYLPVRTSDAATAPAARPSPVSYGSSSTTRSTKTRNIETAEALASPPEYDQIVNYNQTAPPAQPRPLPQRPA